MSDLETLTRTLIQIVGALQDLVTKKSSIDEPQNIQTVQSPKKSKITQLTYTEFIAKALDNKKPIQLTSKKASYRLQQDLILLQQLAKHNIISVKTFEEISKSKKINRTSQSLKSRYNDYLYKIEERDMRKIVEWIEKQGMEGFIVFDNEQMKIQHNDPRQSTERKRERAQNKANQSKQNIQMNKCRKLQKKQNQKVPHPECRQLGQTLKLYSQMTNIPIKSLSEKLDQLSGDLTALDRYIQTKDAKMLWTPEQDQILRKQQSQQQILYRYRGQQNVHIRKKYLGIV